MALIQGIKNANKTGVRFGWCANGGFLEGAGLVPFAHSLLDDRLRRHLINIVPIWKGIDSTSIARSVRIRGVRHESGDSLVFFFCDMKPSVVIRLVHWRLYARLSG